MRIYVSSELLFFFVIDYHLKAGVLSNFIKQAHESLLSKDEMMH